MDNDFHNTSTILSAFLVSIFILGVTVYPLYLSLSHKLTSPQVGPLVLSPLSELYGRAIILNVANVILTCWQLGCDLAPSRGAIIGFRFLAGLGGSACLAIGGGVIADLFPIQQRGLANAMFTMGPLAGPVVGPIMGGFIARRAGWRWVY